MIQRIGSRFFLFQEAGCFQVGEEFVGDGFVGGAGIADLGKNLSEGLFAVFLYEFFIRPVEIFRFIVFRISSSDSCG